MRLSQDNLRRNFPVLMQQLENLPGGLPNIHVAVVSSDMGAGDGSAGGCDSTGGKQGIFQHTARRLRRIGPVPGATYISNIAGAANYSGSLADVFTCIAALGESGCGFRAPVRGDHARAGHRRPRRARREPGLPASRRPAGDRDDHERGRLFGGGGRTHLRHRLEHQHRIAARAADQLPLHEFGHLCNGDPPKRRAPNNDVNASVSYDNCTSRDTPRFLLPSSTSRTGSSRSRPTTVRSWLPRSPDREPYVVRWKTPTTADGSCGAASCPWPQIAHSCLATDGSFADPGRAHRRAARPTTAACNRSATTTLRRRWTTSPPTSSGTSTRPASRGGSRSARHDGRRLHRRRQRHREPRGVVDDTGGAGECWRVVPGGTNCSGVSVVVQADPQGTDDPPGNLTVQCTMCIPGPDPEVGCP